MKLGKLLGAGKTFFGGKKAIAYHADKRVYLPKFNTAKNPFTPKSAGATPVGAPAVKPGSVPVAARVSPTPVPATPRAARVTSWADKLNPFRAPEPVRPASYQAVQVELSLDAVKVVHNDLADADIEIVPVKSRPAPAPEMPMLPPSRTAWEFMGERLAEST